uniref:hypothetical protein n=1 Tax=Thaumasiovibrio occultus TaxID=1891184 RepID=UPI000B350AA9|nr:hypothetical protein [Thaumasiovibrio occultus]
MVKFILLLALLSPPLFALDLPNAISDSELAGYRGGFVMEDAGLISIGISVSSSINGETLYNSHIADMTIRNGELAIDMVYDNGINLTQLGNGNQIELLPTMATESLTTVIQNTLDNSILGISTIVDVDAQIGHVLQDNLFRQQMESAILLSLP